MTDDVFHPEHYNQQGIEVIEVIEAYDLPYHLGNVIKYVCRHGYKGKPLQDLQKALWYLERYVSDLEIEEALTHIGDPEECLPVDEWRTKSAGYSPREVEVFFQGYECCEQEQEEWAAIEEDQLAMGVAFPGYVDPRGFTNDELDAIATKDELYQTFTATLPPDRIAGDDAAATRIKDKYYDYNRFEIKGYCANCDAELGATQPVITDTSAFSEGLKFCSTSCVMQLKTWQGRL